MGSFSIIIPVVVIFFFAMFYMSQMKLRNKILCTFTRPNKTEIEAWIPLYSQEVVFDNGKYGIGRYQVVPDCITMQWYTRDFSKLFPTLVPTMKFVWWSDMPLDPTTGKPSWATPEAKQAGRQEDNIKSLARQVANVNSKKSRFPEWFFPVIIIVAVLIVGFLVYSSNASMSKAIFNLQQQIKLTK
jgi:hypothetical protein